MPVAGLDLNEVFHELPPLEGQLQTVLKLVPAYAWYAPPNGALVFVNERSADYLGLPKDHPLPVGAVTRASWDSHIALHPDDNEETHRIWSRLNRKSS
jgi:hypothetical protein